MSLVDLLGKQPSDPPHRPTALAPSTTALGEQARDLAVVASELASSSTDLAVLDARASSLRDEIAELERRRASLAGEIALERAALRTARDEVSAELRRAEQLHEAATRAEVEASLHRVTSDDAVRRAEVAHAEVAAAEDRVAALRDELAGVESHLAQADLRQASSHQAAIAAEEALRARLAPLERAVVEAQARHDRLERGVTMLQHEHETLLATLDSYTPDDSTTRASRVARQLLADDIARLEADANERRAEQRDLERRSDDLVRSIDELEQTNRVLAESCAALRTSIEDARREHSSISDEITALAAHRSALRSECETILAERDAALESIATARREHQDLAVRTAGRMRELADRQARLDDEVADRVRLDLLQREERLRAASFGTRRRVWKSMLREGRT